MTEIRNMECVDGYNQHPVTWKLLTAWLKSKLNWYEKTYHLFA
jgi:hypothetical protein